MDITDNAYDLYYKVKEAISNNESLDWFKNEGKIIYLTEGSSVDEVLIIDIGYGSGIPSLIYQDHFVITGNPKIRLISENIGSNIREFHYNYTFSKGDVLLIYRDRNSILYICR